MNQRRLGIGATVLAAASLVFGGPAEARNPHCAGGIQYVVGGLRDKEKGNTEDYMRQMNKAVQQLEQCAQEDTADAEAVGYLGWAYAEVDSMGPSGLAFERAIRELEAKGDKKKVEWATGNRNSYWANNFNDGIGKINSGQQLVETNKEEANKLFDQAIVSLTKASLLRRNDPQTLRNLSSVYVFKGDFKTASDAFTASLKVAPGDSSLMAGLRNARINYANQLLEEKKYDEAVGFYSDMLKSDPNNPDLHAGIADANFQKAQKAEGDARKTAFKAAGDAYSKAFSFRKDNSDLAFNAALAYQNSGELALSEQQWRNALSVKPADMDALSSLASVLAEEKKFDEAQKILLQGLATNPQNKTLHRQLGGVYTKANINGKANEELMVYLAMQNGQPVSDAGAAAKGSAVAGAAGAKALASNGAPEALIPWEASGEKYESWFYWQKKQALHFKSGALMVTSDWSSSAPAAKK